MKKKFLSLMMAAAVVATTSVSAFAQDYDNVPEDSGIDHEVTITGDVEDNTGHIKPGTLSVTVPTTATFRIAQGGGFNGSTLEVNNRGNQAVEVYVNEFIDVDGEKNINVVSKEKTSKEASADGAVDRTSVSLNLSGNSGIAYLGTTQDPDKKGVYSDENLNQPVANGKKVSEINAGKKDTLTLAGEAGKKAVNLSEGVQNRFTLKLAIRKKPANKPAGVTGVGTDENTVSQ